jgi:protein SCO1/2
MATAFVLAPDGRLVEALSNFELQPAALAAALGRASDGEEPALVSRLHALCYPFDPARGIYDAAVRRSLQVAAAGLLAAGLFAAWRLRRRRTR